MELKKNERKGKGNIRKEWEEKCQFTRCTEDD